jgi:CRP-like cAMP-binding protein
LHTIAQLPIAALRGFLPARPDARELVERYTAYQFSTAHLFVACNALPPARARAARWILMTADRVAAGEYPLTQEMLAQILGVSRQFLSEVAYELKAAERSTTGAATRGYRSGQCWSGRPVIAAGS